jgi:hypothetical protein
MQGLTSSPNTVIDKDDDDLNLAKSFSQNLKPTMHFL